MGIADAHVKSAVDQDASFAGRAFNDSFCQNLPLGRRETVWQQWALNSDVRPCSRRSRKPPFVSPALNWFRPDIALTAQQAWPPLFSECSNQGVPSHGHARVSQR